MKVELNERKLDLIIQSLVFDASVDVSGDFSPELQDEWLSLAEELIEQTGGDNSPAMTKDENRTLEYNEDTILEDPHLKDRIKKILRV